ncbi:MAG TPA: hypothetical protein VM870_10095 [Pyrinomonadaceae bacterium]|jgi:hypothetical protein|nr:hypothetical protein [Pyrinomonadaceae bacterium]
MLLNKRFFLKCAVVGLVFFMLSCSATRPVDPSAPARGGNAPPYPVSLTTSESKRERSIAAWKKLTPAATANAPLPALAPVTATLTSLPAGGVALRLPQIGDPAATDATTDGEARRESLRRFITAAGDLIGADIGQLSLVEIREQSADRRLARYEQRPFLRPLRNSYGVVLIAFDATGVITDLSSTAIPVDETLARVVNDLAPRLKAEELTAGLTNRTLMTIDAAGVEQVIDLGGAPTIRELVVYPVLRAGEPALDFHLAWEIEVKPAGDGPVRTAYLDAITHELLPPPNDGPPA